MALIKRLDRLDIAVSELDDTVALYQRNFGLALRDGPDGRTAVLAIGDAEIRLLAGPAAAPAIAAAGEGMAALYLEAEDVEAVALALSRAGYAAGPVHTESGRRVLSLDPKAANQVPLFIFDRKA